MAETLPFQAEVQQLLDLVVHSLYSDREIFLRELVSNASDAIDRARFLALENPELRPAEGEPLIRVSVDKDKGTVTVSDNGAGLTREQAVDHLGTIARSGTKAFAQKLREAGTNAEGLIGQFGVGFYASFMVAHRVEVVSLSAEPGAEPIHWESSGGGSFSVEPGTRAQRGTDVILHLRADAQEFCDAARLREIVKKHSDFVSTPVEVDGERVNQESALWTRNPKEVGEDEYKAFYKHVSHDWKDPAAWVHFRSEAPLEFAAVLFFPTERPWDLDHPDVKRGLRLYQRRVLVLDTADQLLPRYLRFVRGMVDAPEVSLNVSRELLQNTPVIAAIKKQLVKRALRRLKELAQEEPEAYLKVWESFGTTLKEGVAEDGDHKDQLLPLLRFRTTTAEGWRDLVEIKTARKDDQDAIWYLTGTDLARMKNAPQLERFKKKGWEVILLSDPVDEWVVMNLTEFDGVPLKSVARGDLDEKEDDPIAEEARKQLEPFVGWLKGELADEVADVRASKRLTESPAALVDSEFGMSANMERILRAARQDVGKARRTLELNPEHPMVKRVAALQAEGKDDAKAFGRLLLDYAQLAEGSVDDPAGFAKRLAELMAKAAG